MRWTEIKEIDRVGVAAEIEIYQLLREDKKTEAPRPQIPSDKREKQSDLVRPGFDSLSHYNQ
jgi:hypothetical protein